MKIGVRHLAEGCRDRAKNSLNAKEGRPDFHTHIWRSQAPGEFRRKPESRAAERQDTLVQARHHPSGLEMTPTSSTGESKNKLALSGPRRSGLYQEAAL